MKFEDLIKIVLAALTLGLAASLWKKTEGHPVEFTKRRIRNEMRHHRRAARFQNCRVLNYFREKKSFLWLLPLSLVSFLASDLFQEYGYYFRASLLHLTPTEFTGTVSPVEKVPDWVALSSAERRLTYDQLPKNKLIPVPEYNLSDFQRGQNWEKGNANERNAYITYPVPNLGNYKLDATENSGSHTGVDIKLPIGTPIRSIAAGSVFRTGYQKTGFGHYVVVAHVMIPNPEREGKKTTLFSVYAHLSSVNVKEGAEVKKGQVIGKSGESGTASTPHLHFQIDRDTAPFHPYWPFQWKDVQNAGYNSFFEAVKHGVGKANAEKYTYHPMDFIAHYDDYIPGRLLAANTVEKEVETPTNEVASADISELDTTSEETVKEVETAEKEVKEIASSEDLTTRQTVRTGQLEITFETDRSFVPGQEEIVRLRVNEEALVASAGGIELSATDRRAARVTPATLTVRDFIDNVAEVTVKSEANRTFKLIALSEFGEAKSPSLRPQIFADVDGSHTYSPAIKYLKDRKIVKGYADGTFKPEATINRAEAVKIILVGNDIAAKKGKKKFPDVPETAWFSDFVTTAADRGIIKGYGDGAFKPGNTITRAEFLKVAILTSGFEPEDKEGASYPDVADEAWYKKYFQFAKVNELLRMKKGGFITPNMAITRAEAADVMYRLSRLKTKQRKK